MNGRYFESHKYCSLLRPVQRLFWIKSHCSSLVGFLSQTCEPVRPSQSYFHQQHNKSIDLKHYNGFVQVMNKGDRARNGLQRYAWKRMLSVSVSGYNPLQHLSLSKRASPGRVQIQGIAASGGGEEGTFDRGIFVEVFRILFCRMFPQNCVLILVLLAPGR